MSEKNDEKNTISATGMELKGVKHTATCVCIAAAALTRENVEKEQKHKR